MAKKNNLTDFVTDLANHIRDKVGLPTTTKINPQNFGDAIAENPNLTLVYTQTDRITTDGADYGQFLINLATVPGIANLVPYAGSGANAVNLIYVYVCVVELTASAMGNDLTYDVYQEGDNGTEIICKMGNFSESNTKRVTFGVIDNLCYFNESSITRDTLKSIGGYLTGFENGKSCTVTTNVYRLSVGTEAIGGSNPLAVSTCKGVLQS